MISPLLLLNLKSYGTTRYTFQLLDTVDGLILKLRKAYSLYYLDKGPDNRLVLDNNMIIPSSYINSARIRAFWNNNLKSFMFDINKNQTDASKEIISADNQEQTQVRGWVPPAPYFIYG